MGILTTVDNTAMYNHDINTNTTTNVPVNFDPDNEIIQPRWRYLTLFIMVATGIIINIYLIYGLV